MVADLFYYSNDTSFEMKLVISRDDKRLISTNLTPMKFQVM